jgi:fumarate hydratase, class II
MSPSVQQRVEQQLPLEGMQTLAVARTETDSFGSIQVPAEALWGAQTARSLTFFAIGEQRMPVDIVHALAEVKRAAAEVNGTLGLLETDRAAVIAEAARRVAGGELDEQFPLSVWQTGSGTQSHMNVNEVIASLASCALGGGPGAERRIHPNDDVNLGQSSNDVFPTAMHVAAVLRAKPLLASLKGLRVALREKANTFSSMLKVGRTHLQDAVPVTFGQEFGAYDAQLAIAETAIERALSDVHALAIGGTAVGTGLNTHAEFGTRVAAVLAHRLKTPFVLASNLFAAMAGHEALVALHGSLRTLAVALNKIANDIRLMGSGPRAGLGELRLPANEPGSSMMPGKVNPTQVEALTMVCAQVMGHDVAIGIAASQGQFELNAYKPLIALNLLDSLRLLADAMTSIRDHCIAGLSVETQHVEAVMSNSLIGVTALVPHIGYDRAALIARHAHEHGISLRRAPAHRGQRRQRSAGGADPRLAPVGAGLGAAGLGAARSRLSRRGLRPPRLRPLGQAESGYSYDTLADDLQRVMDQCDLQDVTLVGFSMGGGEVARYIARHGESRLHSVVFAAAVPPYLMKTADNPDGPLTPEKAQEKSAAFEAGPQCLLRRSSRRPSSRPTVCCRSPKLSAARRSFCASSRRSMRRWPAWIPSPPPTFAMT